MSLSPSFLSIYVFVNILAGLFFALGLGVLAISFSRRLGLMDMPGALPHKSHTSPTPLAGGLTLVLALLSGLLLLNHGLFRSLWGVILPALIVFGVGLWDDFRRLPAGVKLLGQVVASILLIAFGTYVRVLKPEATGLPSELALLLNWGITIFWVVGITNAFNLLDNMDGLSAGVAFVASLVLLVNAWILGEFFISLVLVALMGSLLGFLVYNFHPASIFLGDCGSLFIGFTLASLTLLQRYVSHASSTLFPVLMPVLVLALPILDTATVTFIRLREGRPIYVGDSRHLSHRLVSLGMRPPLAVFTIYLVSLGIGLGAVGLAHADLVHALLILVQALAVVAVVLILLFYERRAQPRGEEP